MVFIDGFNLYHSLDNVPAYKKYKWLNLWNLSETLLFPGETLVSVFYFTAYTDLPSPILSAGFHMQHWAYLPELFKHMPQSVELGSTFHGAYIFSGNVVLENT